MVDQLERLGAVGGLLLMNLIMLWFIQNRLTSEMRRERESHSKAIYLLVAETAGLRNDLTFLLIRKDMPEADVLIDRSARISQTIEKMRTQLSGQAG